jgi:hypothetical protein
VSDEGSPLTQRAILNFVGSGVTVTDGGTETIVTIPSGGTATYAQDLVTVSNVITDKIITLSNTPVMNSENVIWNGLVLRKGLTNDYTILGMTVTLNSDIILTIGDEIMVSYAY